MQDSESYCYLFYFETSSDSTMGLVSIILLCAIQSHSIFVLFRAVTINAIQSVPIVPTLLQNVLFQTHSWPILEHIFSNVFEE